MVVQSGRLERKKDRRIFHWRTATSMIPARSRRSNRDRQFRQMLSERNGRERDGVTQANPPIRRAGPSAKVKGRSQAALWIAKVRRYAIAEAIRAFRPRPKAAKPSPTKPASIMAQVAGSGTVVMLRV
jgi:hypothetical protein